MSDRLSAAFEPLHDVPPPVAFATPDAVRRRGRQRRRAHRVAAGCAAAAAVAGVLAGVPLLRDSPPATSAATPTSGSLLEVRDLGAGAWLAPHRRVQEPGRSWFWAGACGGESPTLARQRAAESAVFTDAPRRVVQTVEVYEAGWGAASMTDVRAAVTGCASGPSAVVVQAGFAGHDSLLVRVADPPSEPAARYVGVARVGDRVATVATYGFDAAYTTGLTVRAAALLD